MPFAKSSLWRHERFYGRPRQEWKERAVSYLAHRSGDTAWLTNEIAKLKAPGPDKSSPEDWLSESLILMRSGEWLAYTNICAKQDARIHDLFLARGSDGKWYYSTYHFCVSMIVLRMGSETEGQPESLTKFARSYFLREFDGHSNDCLNETWNPREHRPVSAGVERN